MWIYNPTLEQSNAITLCASKKSKVLPSASKTIVSLVLLNLVFLLNWKQWKWPQWGILCIGSWCIASFLFTPLHLWDRGGAHSITKCRSAISLSPCTVLHGNKSWTLVQEILLCYTFWQHFTLQCMQSTGDFVGPCTETHCSAVCAALCGGLSGPH